MKIALYTDGRPGHEKQSRAIIESLERFTEVEVQTVTVARSSLLKKVVQYLKLIMLPAGGCSVELGNPDLLIGTGSSTHLPVLSAKKRYKTLAVTCMTPDYYLRYGFDLCFVPEHDAVKPGRNIFYTVGPPVLSVPELERDDSRGLILIGGIDHQSHTWHSEKIVSYIKEILEVENTMNWVISSSPRTPEDTVIAIKEIIEGSDNVTFWHYRDTPDGWLEQQYATASKVWVTADSVSMIYESLTAGCRVGFLPLQWKKEQNKFQQSLDYLLKKKKVIDFSQWKDNRGSWGDEGEFNEALRCAKEIIHRWF